MALAPDTAIARNNAPPFAFSLTGTLVRPTGYLKGSRREPMHPVAVTAAGTRKALSAEAALCARGLALSSADNTIWMIDTERGTRVKLPPAPIVSSASASSDGRFVAYESAASGEYQVYVRPLSSEGERVSVTASGGRFPVWSRDGRTLFFRRGREVRAVSATVTADGIRFGEERAVLEWDVARSFEVGPDGTFYGVEPVPGAAEQTSLEVRTGWFAEVERLAGPRRGESRP